MIARPMTARLARTPVARDASTRLQLRHFSATQDNKAKNRIYTPVRYPSDFQTYLSLSSSARQPLLTLWTASYCRSCATISPLLHALLTAGVGEAQGGVAYAEIEYDSADIMSSGLGMTYLVTSMPTLLSFDRGEPQDRTRVVDLKQLADRDFLTAWIEREAVRRGTGGAGGDGLLGNSRLLGGLFGRKD